MSYHKSGAQKRKEKQNKLELSAKKSRTLFEVGLKLTDKTSTCTTNIDAASTNSVEAAGLSVTSNIPSSLENNDKVLLNSKSLHRSTKIDAASSNSVETAGPSFSSSDPSSLQNNDGDYVDSVSLQRSHLKINTEDTLDNSKLNTDVVGDCNHCNLSSLTLSGHQQNTVTISTSDLGQFIDINCITSKDIETLVKIGPHPFPKEPPSDGKRAFPRSVLVSKQANGESVPRDWLSWSETAQSIHCFPCRLFGSVDTPHSNKSVLLTNGGWKKEYLWRKLYNKLPIHETSTNHKRCYMKWRQLEMSLKNSTDIASRLDDELIRKTENWKELFRRILSVVLFLAERGLPFRGTSCKIGESSNGNFLGILELLSNYDPILKEHVSKVRQSQLEGKRLQAHYLSPESQNEFIEACSARVTQAILNERRKSKYFSILADATPDTSHTEQTTFVLRYVLDSEEEFKIAERFLCFVDCNKKTGKDIANLIVNQLNKFNIPLDECRGQGYDNGANMSGLYNGAQAIISEMNPLALFSNCGAHSLNLCGTNAAECCEEVVTFFGMVQKTYTFFSRSPQRWEILEKHIGCSLHGISQTRWSARVESVKPFAKHLPLIKHALDECKSLNLSAESKTDLKAIIKYLNSFKCVLMATIWLKVLAAIDIRNKVLQARDATLDVEVANIEDLLKEIKLLRNRWDSLISEAKLIAENINSDYPCETSFSKKRLKKRKLAYGEKEDEQAENEEETREEREFKVNVFYRLMDSVISGLTERFKFSEKVNKMFNVLWNYQKLNEDDVKQKCISLQSHYPDDLGLALGEEVEYMKSIHECNFGTEPLKPLSLLNKLKKLKLENLFPNVCIALRIFCTIPVTVAEAERSFSKMKLIKSILRSTMGQNRMSSLALLSIESEITKTINFEDVISDFSSKRARRIIL